MRRLISGGAVFGPMVAISQLRWPGAAPSSLTISTSTRQPSALSARRTCSSNCSDHKSVTVAPRRVPCIIPPSPTPRPANIFERGDATTPERPAPGRVARSPSLDGISKGSGRSPPPKPQRPGPALVHDQDHDRAHLTLSKSANPAITSAPTERPTIGCEFRGVPASREASVRNNAAPRGQEPPPTLRV